MVTSPLQRETTEGMSMRRGARQGTQKVKSEAQKEALLDLIGILDRRGYTQARIGQLIGNDNRFGFTLSTTQVSEYLKTIKARYREKILHQREELIAEKLEQYREVRAEAWAEWERSKENAERVVTETAPVPVKKDDNGKKRPKALNNRERQIDGWKEEMRKVKEAVTTEGRLGNPAYLTIVLETLDAERQLLGIDELVAALTVQTKKRSAVVDEIAQIMSAVEEQIGGLPAKKEPPRLVESSPAPTDE